jgi:tetratricopeptide (TPR) repeat protein
MLGFKGELRMEALRQNQGRTRLAWIGAMVLLVRGPLGAAQAGDPSQGPKPKPTVEVTVFPFEKVAGDARLGRLQAMLPQVLAFSLRNYQWIDVNVVEKAGGDKDEGEGTKARLGPNGPSKNIPRFTVSGRFAQIGQKIRLSIEARNTSDQSVAFADSSVASEEELVSAVAALAARLAEGLRLRANAPGSNVGFKIVSPFQYKPSSTPPSQPPPSLGEWLSDAVVSQVLASKVQNVTFKQIDAPVDSAAATEKDAVIWLSYTVADNQVTASASIREAGVQTVSLDVSSTMSRVAAIPERLSKQIVEVARARVSPEGGWRNEPISLTEGSVEDYSRQAERYDQQGDYYQSILMYRKVLQLNPRSNSAHVYLSSVYLGLDDMESATWEANDVLSYDPNDGSAETVLGILSFSKNEYEEATALLSRALQMRQTSGSRSVAFEYLGNTYMAQGKSDQAIPKYQRALQENHENDDAYRELAQAYLSTKDSGRAIEWLEKGLRELPNDEAIKGDLAVVYKRLGEQSFAAGQFNEAAKHYAMMLSVGAPESSLGRNAYDQTREAYHRANKDGECERLFKSLLEKDAQNIGYLGTLSFITHEYLGEFQQAYEFNQAWAKLDADNIGVESNLAEASMTTGRFDEAMVLANKVLASKEATVADRLSMELITVSSLILSGKRSGALSQIGEFIGYFKSLPADYERTWTYTGTRRYINDQREIAKEDKSLILSLVDILESRTMKDADNKVRLLQDRLTGLFASTVPKK